MREATDVRERIARVFSGALNLDVPSDDTDLFDTGVLDSLAFVELLVHLEREFGLATSVEDLEVDNFRTIAHIAEFVQTRTSAPARVVYLHTRR
jgi:methoxymalonate biosynthesis acyl carrier protein